MENQKKESIRLPNAGCKLVGIDYNTDGTYTVRYKRSPGMHAQVIVDTGIALPVDDSRKIRYKVVQDKSPSLMNLEEQSKLAESHLESVISGITQRAEQAQREFYKSLVERLKELGGLENDHKIWYIGLKSPVQ